ncbi:Spore germination protein [Tissierella praeacuta DSM 18095]|uniref:Spore germination protein n=1 Tax=Tissierella praeacuta DSM 18095 TaxID=1123404 RepID=A0A1M4V5C2_9FIRM|nr:endospore germination permease [Tissierella praeacuta]TCU74085.1 spore germination protein (amino acid permease) [Tissierella praeacuta]SHE64145.1 Spore germination protein [Tissierella praeacuta DSM 18095]SUP02916.1 Spore germination protein YndE [Tissierella praeacuta]
MNEKVSSRQAIFIITISRITTVLTIMSPVYMSPANQDVWISIILSFFYTILTCVPLLFLANKFKEFTIIGYMEKILGKILGKIVGILYAIFFATIAIFFSYISVQMIRASFLSDTKTYIIILFLIASCLYIVSKELVVILRFSELMVPIILVSLIIFIFLGYNNMDFKLLLPIYKDSTFLDINIGAMQLSLVFIDIYSLTMIVPSLEDKKRINEIFIKASIISLLFVLGTVLATQSSLGVEQVKHFNYPFLAYIRNIRAYFTFERIESIYIFIWIIAMIIKIITYLCISIDAFKEIFKKESRNILLYIVCIMVALITFYIAEVNPMMVEIKSIKFPEYIYYFIFKTIIPLIAVIVYFFRRKTLEEQEKLKN